jgi:two-component system response regulator RegA
VQSVASTEAIAREAHKVLVIDDHELFLKNVARDFTRQGVEVFKATTLAEAVRLCETQHPDLAIVDLFLTPPEDGLQLLTALKAIDPGLFTIIVSAHMSVAHAVMAVRAGADDVFLKPFKAVRALARYAGQPVLAAEETLSLQQIEWEHISRALQDYDGNITHAAESLGVLRQSLQRKMKRHAPRVLIEQGERVPRPPAMPAPRAPAPRAAAPAASAPKTTAPKPTAPRPPRSRKRRTPRS